MKIAVLGGSFDPPHIGHWLVAFQIREILNFDQVWLMPCYQHPFRKKISPAIDRFKMTQYLTNKDKNIRVNDLELNQKKVSFTIDTLNLLSVKYPKYVFQWVIGSEQVKTFNQWKEWQKIISRFGLIIFPRQPDNHLLKEEIKTRLKLQGINQNITILQSARLITTNLSSTIIRSRVKKGQTISHLVPKEVERYIINHQLYQGL